MFFYLKQKNKGYSLIELLIYISLFVVVAFVAIESFFTMSRAFKETNIQSSFVKSGFMLEKISRDIRQANEATIASATHLTLNTLNDLGNDVVVDFELNGTDLRFSQNGSFVANLNPAEMSVESLSFTEIITNKGKAVKVFFTVSSKNDSLGRDMNFYNTLILRGKY